jgi:hypothetical protein
MQPMTAVDKAIPAKAKNLQAPANAPLSRIILLTTAGLNKKNSQPVFALNLENRSPVEDCKAALEPQSG